MPYHFKNLIFEGGGVKGVAYAGAIKVLEERGILQQIRRVSGTSAGAITATFLALGGNSNAIENILLKTDLNTFRDGFWLSNFLHFSGTYGWYEGKVFEAWLREHVDCFCGEPDITFARLHEKTAELPSKYKDLFVVGTNLTRGASQVYSYESTPTMKIVDAIRISMSIPLFFRTVCVEKSVMVDGGLSYNYPIDIFDDKRYLYNEMAGLQVNYPTKYNGTHVYNKETLGFRVDTADEIKAELCNQERPPKDIKSMIAFFEKLADFCIAMANKSHLHKNDWARTVFIDANGVNATDFSLGLETQKQLINNGISGTVKYFTWYDNSPSDDIPFNKM